MMKLALSLAAALSLTGCYTQLYTRGYAERAVYPYPYEETARAPGDSAAGDSLAAADSARPPATVIVNNYYPESRYYRGYSLDAWDYPFISFGFYSGRYRDYYGPYWWHGSHYRRGGYHPRYEGGAGGGPRPDPGPYQSDKRLFAPAPVHPAPGKGRRPEPAQAAPKAADPGPSQSQSGSSSTQGSDDSGGGANSSEKPHPTLHKGRRR
jgi:hypothetical protein